MGPSAECVIGAKQYNSSAAGSSRRAGALSAPPDGGGRLCARARFRRRRRWAPRRRRAPCASGRRTQSTAGGTWRRPAPPGAPCDGRARRGGRGAAQYERLRAGGYCCVKCASRGSRTQHQSHLRFGRGRGAPREVVDLGDEVLLSAAVELRRGGPRVELWLGHQELFSEKRTSARGSAG